MNKQTALKKGEAPVAGAAPLKQQKSRVKKIRVQPEGGAKSKPEQLLKMSG